MILNIDNLISQKTNLMDWDTVTFLAEEITKTLYPTHRRGVTIMCRGYLETVAGTEAHFIKTIQNLLWTIGQQRASRAFKGPKVHRKLPPYR